MLTGTETLTKTLTETETETLTRYLLPIVLGSVLVPALRPVQASVTPAWAEQLRAERLTAEQLRAERLKAERLKAERLAADGARGQRREGDVPTPQAVANLAWPEPRASAKARRGARALRNPASGNLGRVGPGKGPPENLPSTQRRRRAEAPGDARGQPSARQPVESEVPTRAGLPGKLLLGILSLGILPLGIDCPAEPHPAPFATSPASSVPDSGLLPLAGRPALSPRTPQPSPCPFTLPLYPAPLQCH